MKDGDMKSKLHVTYKHPDVDTYTFRQLDIGDFFILRSDYASKSPILRRKVRDNMYTTISTKDLYLIGQLHKEEGLGASKLIRVDVCNFVGLFRKNSS